MARFSDPSGLPSASVSTTAVIDNAVIAFRDFAGECPARCPNLNRHLMNVSHTIPKFEYSIGRRHLSLNDFVVA